MADNKTYHIDIKDNILTLKTTSFKAERGSVLHRGIYSSELRSSLVGGAVVLAMYLIFRPEPTFICFILAIIQFAVFFVFFRMFIFYEPSLETTIDKAQGRIKVTLKKFLGTERIHPLSDLDNITQGHLAISPENPDAVRVVERIALQHGTAIPGFGEIKEFYTVTLKFKDRERVLVFSSSEQSHAEDVYARLKGFINA